MEEIKRLILNLTPKEAKEMGIKYMSSLNYVKKKAREGKLNLNPPVVKRILRYYSS